MCYQYQVSKRKECVQLKRKKFLRKKALLLGTTAVLLIVFVSLGFVYNGRGQAAAEKDEAPVIVMVQPGDTLWGIAKNHGKRGEDIRSLVFEIRKINDLKDACIYPGQKLIFPQ